MVNLVEVNDKDIPYPIELDITRRNFWMGVYLREIDLGRSKQAAINRADTEIELIDKACDYKT